MKVIFLLSALVVSSSAFASKAQGCLNQMIGIRMAVLMKNAIDESRNSDHFGNEVKDDLYNSAPVHTVCAKISQKSQDDIDEKRSSLLKIKSNILKQFATNKSISGVTYVGIFGDSQRTQITQEDVCEDARANAQNALDVDGNECSFNGYLTTASASAKVDVLNGSTSDVCQRLLPVIRGALKKSRDCENDKEKKKAAKKANQGDGISPDVPTHRNLPAIEAKPSSRGAKGSAQ